MAAATANAQMKMRFGPRAGVDMTSITVSPSSGLDLTSTVGFHAGVTAEFWLNDNWSINPSLLYAMKGYSEKYSVNVTNGNLTYSESRESTVHLNYIEIPILLGYSYGMDGWKIGGEVGPYLGYALSGTYKNKATTNGVTTESSGSVTLGSGEAELNPLDFGLKVGPGVEFSNLKINLYYSMGLTNLSNASGETIKNWGAGLSLAYMFGGE